MTLKPSAQRLGGAIVFTIVTTILAYFLPSPHPDVGMLPGLIAMGLVVGYLMWPMMHTAWSHRGSLQPTPERILKVLVIAGLGTTLLAGLNYFILRDDLLLDGLLVTFLFLASCVYMKLGTPRAQH